MMKSLFDLEWERQNKRNDIPPGHLPVHRWYLRLDQPQSVSSPTSPLAAISIVRAENPTVPFYRFLYHTAGENYLWGDRRRFSDSEIADAIRPSEVHLMVLYNTGTPAGFFEVSFETPGESHIRYLALLPGFTGSGLGRYLLESAIAYAGNRAGDPLFLDTCTLDHPVALNNYLSRGFQIFREIDLVYPDPRLDGTIPKSAASSVALARP